MTLRPLVSVILPTRNRADTLLRCLAALAAQDYRPFEIIVIDDASADATPTALMEFAAAHPDLPLRILRNDPQLGANPSRNRAIREAQGELLAFLDDDCIAAPDWLSKLTAAFTSDTVTAVTGRVDNAPPRSLYDLALQGTSRVAKVGWAESAHRAGANIERPQQADSAHPTPPHLCPSVSSVSSVDSSAAPLPPASRLVAGNMCIRRRILEQFILDEDRSRADPDISVSGRGDEDGLYLRLRAAGHQLLLAADAVVIHEHFHTRRSFFRQAYRSGASTARLGYKYHLPPRIELLALLMAWLLLPVTPLHSLAWLAPTISAAFFLAAITYNELFRKCKSAWQTLITLPLLLAYYHARLAGYVVQYARLLVGRDHIRRIRLTDPPNDHTPPASQSV